ncbi:hypothetical protein CASFOL_012536 [Castilleja foliolosa]|uniref:O-fucosyltransferase family protein n=1 Tax=Castilleja foliolosa TaxID=1961234 RepID=A0ABD3DHB8_9LAMI
MATERWRFTVALTVVGRCPLVKGGVKRKAQGFSQKSKILHFIDFHLRFRWDPEIMPYGMRYRPCLDFSKNYLKDSGEIMKDRTKYLVVVVSGGMNQQRNQIVDAVVIARILGAVLVVPILQVNVIWGEESEFGVRVMVAARARRVTALLNSGGEHGQVMVAAIVQVSDLGYWGPIEMSFCSDLGGLWIGCFPAATWVTSSRVGLRLEHSGD